MWFCYATGWKRLAVLIGRPELADDPRFRIYREVWDDVGAWSALENHFDKTPEGNIVIGDAQLVDGGGNLVLSPDRLTALIGVDDLVVVHSENATLICAKDREQDVKKMVGQLKAVDRFKELL